MVNQDGTKEVTGRKISFPAVFFPDRLCPPSRWRGRPLVKLFLLVRLSDRTKTRKGRVLKRARGKFDSFVEERMSFET